MSAAPMAKRLGIVFLATLFLVLTLALLGPGSVRTVIVEGAGDYCQFYIGSRLGANRYDSGLVFEQQKIIIGEIKPDMLPNRLPFYYAILSPLSKLPYKSAHTVWLVLQTIAAVAATMLLWKGNCSFAMGLSPAFVSICVGQDSAFLLLVIAASLRLYSSGRPFWAGAVASLMSIKYHLFVLVPLAFLGETALLWGAFAGGTFLIAMCFLSDGPAWPARYLHLLTGPGMNPGPEVMPNLHGLFYRSHWMEWSAVLLVLVATFSIAKSRRKESFSVALVGSFLISMHAYFADLVVLVPALVSQRKIPAFAWLALSPLAVLMLMLKAGYVVSLMLLANFALLIWSAVEAPASDNTDDLSARAMRRNDAVSIESSRNRRLAAL